jgi:hypothetical protein
MHNGNAAQASEFSATSCPTNVASVNEPTGASRDETFDDIRGKQCARSSRSMTSRFTRRDLSHSEDAMFRSISDATQIRMLAAASLLGLTAIAGAAAAHAATSRASYDGAWSVLIVTERGTCDRAYRYPVRIRDGAVGYAGQSGFTVSGRVNPNGAIVVRVSRGNQSANGTGRLSQGAGRGTWRAGECSGVWTAERR